MSVMLKQLGSFRTSADGSGWRMTAYNDWGYALSLFSVQPSEEPNGMAGSHRALGRDRRRLRARYRADVREW